MSPCWKTIATIFRPTSAPWSLAKIPSQRLPGLREAIEELSGKLPDAVMRKLNFAVDGEHRPPAQVAARFLDATFPTGR